MMKRMFQEVVERGTGQPARLAGYTAAGKSGTAQKIDASGRYSRSHYISSFVGFAPVSDPRIVVAVMIDDPRAGRYYGGDVAAPAFGAIAAGTLRALQITPDSPSMQFAQAAAPGG